MQNNNANVSYNPYIGNLDGIISAVVKKNILRLQTCIPAIVKEVKGRDRVVVSPAVQQIDSKWQSVPWADISLPVCTPSGNGLFVSFPLAVGDTGWIIAGDLDPSLFFKDKTRPQRQNLMNRHEYQFGYFVPDTINGYSVSSDNDGALVIGSKDGSTEVVISNNGLKIKSDSIIIETTDNASVTIDGVNWKNHTHTAKWSPQTLTLAVNTQTNTATNTEEISKTTGGVNS